MSMVKEALRTKAIKTNEGRTVAGIVNSIETLKVGDSWCAGRFPRASFSDFDPFLLLDEMGPMDVAPGEAKGAPDHPHRGFETVTYMLSGGNGAQGFEWARWTSSVRRRAVDDCRCRRGSMLRLPSAGSCGQVGGCTDFSSGVNLPQRDKMVTPQYQEIFEFADSQSGHRLTAWVSVSVIAGEAMGRRER